jgi:DNA-binding transcriptional LysR family regulator
MPSGFDLKQCRYFMAVAEELHFGRAAMRLGIAQPPLTRQIHGLEDALGYELFDRSRRAIQLTPTGHAFLIRARQLLALAARATEAARRAGSKQAGDLRVGYSHITDPAMLLPIRTNFARLLPSVKVQLLVDDPRTLAADLLSNKVDIAFLVRHPLDPALCYESLPDEPIIVALPEAHRLAGRASIDLSELADEGFLPPPSSQSPVLHEKFVEHCVQNGFRPRLAHESPHLQATLALVAAGAGVSVMPRFMGGAPPAGVRYVPLKGSLKTLEMGFAWRRAETRESVLAFLSAIRRYARQALAASA